METMGAAHRTHRPAPISQRFSDEGLRIRTGIRHPAGRATTHPVGDSLILRALGPYFGSAPQFERPKADRSERLRRDIQVNLARNHPCATLLHDAPLSAGPSPPHPRIPAYSLLGASAQAQEPRCESCERSYDEAAW